MRLIWTRRARTNRRSIREYIAKENPEAALSLDEVISSATARLTDNPSIGRIGRVTGTRELVAHHNYILVYDLRGDTVRVLRVLHAAMQWPPDQANQEKGGSA